MNAAHHARRLHLARLALCCAVLLAPAAQAAGVPGLGTWQTTLQARDLDGNLSNGAEAYFDTTLQITWLADAFQARTSGYQARPFYAPGDSLIWPHAIEWADNLALYGITDWRLPASTDLGAPGCFRTNSGGDCGFNVNPASSEMAHLFHVTLGNLSYLTPQGIQAANGGLRNTGPFSNVLAGHHWSQTSASATLAWNFDMGFGSQDLAVKTAQGSAAWAVLDGDRGTPLSAVPEPATWMMLAAGCLLLGARRRPAARPTVTA